MDKKGTNPYAWIDILATLFMVLSLLIEPDALAREWFPKIAGFYNW